jgi:tRNA-guanine family transglycosylase
VAEFFGVITGRDYIHLSERYVPFWDLLDTQPHGWLTSLANIKKDIPHSKVNIFDCGAWSYRNIETPKLKNKIVTPEWAVEQYRKYARERDIVVAPDHMLIPDVDIDARKEFNRTNAERFIELVDSCFSPMGVIHGRTIDERIESVDYLLSLGYRHFAIGGVAANPKRKNEVRLIVDSVVSHIGTSAWVHVFGLSSPEYARMFTELGVSSFDGSSYFKKAFTAGIFHWLDDKCSLVSFSAEKDGVPTAPACDCCACRTLREHGEDTRLFGNSKRNIGRAAHNLNMLMIAQRETVAR